MRRVYLLLLSAITLFGSFFSCFSMLDWVSVSGARGNIRCALWGCRIGVRESATGLVAALRWRVWPYLVVEVY